jgi:catechol 2,3-dioxygenase-like lactoylglutathione lyase family enzyme
VDTKITKANPETTEMPGPYESRTGAVLFAERVDRVAAFYAVVLGLAEAKRDDDHVLLESPGFQLVVHRIPEGRAGSRAIAAPPVRRAEAAYKPVFFVPSLGTARDLASSHGGMVEPVDREWTFNGVTVCDGVDPEGNVIQFREARE